jgi:predicted secreted protein
MPTTKLKGIEAVLYVTSAAMLGLQDYTLNVDMGDVSVADHNSAGWDERMTTLATWTASAKGWYIGDSTTGVQETGQAALVTAATATAPGDVLTVEFRPHGTGSGKVKFAGSCRVKKWSVGAPTTGAQSFDVDLVGVGALTPGTQT